MSIPKIQTVLKLAVLLILFTGLFAFGGKTSPVFADKPAIPDGCPGSGVSLNNVPPNDRAAVQKLCASIPAGCPGSSKNAPAKKPDQSKCKYAAPSKQTGNKGGTPPPTATDSAATSGNCASASKCDLVSKYVNPIVEFLSVLVGLAVVISIIIGGIQYSSSGGDPQKVTAAKNRIRNAVVAFVFYIFLFAALNFLVPGGV